MKEVKRVLIDEGVCNYIQMLAYEVDGLRVLNCQIIRSGGSESDTYEKFLKRYLEANVNYNLAFGELCKELVPEYLCPRYKKEVSFLTGELIVSEVGQC